MLEKWRVSISVIRSGEFAGRSKRRRSGAESVPCERSVLDHDDCVVISTEKWVAKSHILLDIHCEK